MGKALLRLLFSASLLMVVSQAWAVDRGRWLCTDCSIENTLKSGDRMPAAGEVVAFIKEVVNGAEFPQELRSSGWLPNDIVVICNGSLCLPLAYHASGVFIVLGPAYKDPRSKYKNSAASVRWNGNPATAIDIVVTGHWEWYDVYNGNGDYVYSTDPVYVIDSVTFVSNPTPRFLIS